MSPKNNLEQREARELAAAEGVNYTTALRKVREGKGKDPAPQEADAAIEQWRKHWGSAFLGAGFGSMPALLRADEFASPEDAPSDAPDRPTVTAFTFRLPSVAFLDKLALHGPELASYFGADACPVTPVGMIDADGNEILGTIGNEAFRLWHTTEPCATADPLDPTLDPWFRHFLVLAFVMPRLSAIEGVGRCTLVHSEALSHETLLARNITIRFKPSPGVGVATVRDRLPAIKDILGVKWALVEADPDTANPMVAGTTIALHLGDGPRKGEEPSLDLARTQLVLDIIETAKFTARENPQRSWSAEVLRQEMVTFNDSTLARLRDALSGSDRRFAEILAADILSGLPEEQHVTFLDRVDERKRTSQQVTA